jgi:diguanylate cyclase (GGDEF)-like protein
MGVTRAAFDAASGRLTVKEHLNSSNGLSSDKVFLMGEDAHGNLWVGSGMGVDRVTGSQVEHFSQGDGLVNDDTNSMSFLADPNGDVWVGTSLGLARFDASAYKGAPEPPATAILGFRMGGQEFFTLPQHPVSVPHQSNTFEVSFAGLSFIRGGDVKHQVRLVGLEPEWRLTDDRTQRYPALAPGWYTFEVRARVGMGPWGPVSRIVFQVRPAWWQAWWFRGLLALGASCLVLLVIRWRLAALEARNHQLEEMVTRRTFEVQTKAQELERVNEALRNQSLTDPLTGLRNRRFLGVCMPEDVARVNRVHRDVNRGAESRVHLNIDLVFIMVDIDHFKSVNDQHGHGAGDRVLQQMAEILRQATRETDTVVRWGGEEFLVVARNAARRDSVILAERIRSLVEAHPFDLGDGKVLRRTCSVGFTFFPFLCAVPELFNWEQAIDLADHCLYAAKHGGRNAWVGVYPREDADPEDLRQRLPMEIEELVESGRLTAVHHERPGFRLAWEIRP